MATANLEDVYAALLQDMVSADEQSLDLTERLRDAATSDDLRDALEDGVCGIGDGLELVQKLSEAHPVEESDYKSDGMSGLVADTQERVFETDFANETARDAAILAQYMHLTYYGLAGYRTLAAIASQLGFADEAEDLQTCYENAQDGQDDMIGLLDGTLLEGAS